MPPKDAAKGALPRARRNVRRGGAVKSNELAKLAGVTVRTLRHYHAIDLLDEPQRQAAVDACVGFLSKLIDCFDPQNWLRADKDYEVLLDRTASESFNSAQIDVSEQIFGEFARILVRRRDGEGDCG